MKFYKKIQLIFLLITALFLFCSCATTKDTASENAITSVEDLAGKKIGVITGSIFDEIVLKYIDNPQLEYFNTNPDLIVALEDGKIDAYISDEPIMRLILAETPTQKHLDTLEDDSYGFVFPKTAKGDALRNQMDEFLTELKDSGELEKIDEIWFGNDESKKFVDLDSLSGENGTLVYTLNSTQAPFSYIKDGKFVGYEVDIVYRFCQKYGYKIKAENCTFVSIISAITSSKADIGSNSISITEERKKSIYFSQPDYIGGIVVIVKNDAANISSNSNIKDSFLKTFITEERWKLFGSGLITTVLITILATILGTIFGFLLSIVYHQKNKLTNKAFDIVGDILEKTPVVVILMILYYIFFNKSKLNGIWVSTIGFTIMFAWSFIRIVNNGVNAIDKGQTEAAWALGFSDTETFLHIILPQAATHFLPTYRANIVSLLKDTAIVGYIAVQDLTKVSDIIRARTYEAFFPLIASAIIYFLLAWSLTQLIKHIEIKTNPKNRNPKRILKGIHIK